MLTRNNCGPRTDPSGTPIFTSARLELYPVIETYYFLFDREDLNQSLARPRIP